MYSFALFDASNNPIVGAEAFCHFTAYRTLSRTELSQPSIVNLGGNIYALSPSPADESVGVAFMVDTNGSGAIPRYYSGSVGNLAAFGVWGSTGAPKADAVPVIDTYVGADTTPHAPPAVTNIGLGLYGWLPTDADRANNVAFSGRTISTGALPACFFGLVAPEVGGGGAGPVLITLTPYGDRIELTFSSSIALSGVAAAPSGWSIATVTSEADIPILTGVSVAGNIITLFLTECTGGAVYYLHIPATGIADLSANPFGGPWVSHYVGVGVAPFVALAGAEDALHAKVIFSEPVVESEALIPTNYTITGGAGLTVYSVDKETDLVYRLTTSLQVVGQVYTVTVTGIHDLHGNLI